MLQYCLPSVCAAGKLIDLMILRKAKKLRAVDVFMLKLGHFS